MSKKYRLLKDWLYYHGTQISSCTYGKGLGLVQSSENKNYYIIEASGGTMVPASIVESNSNWFELIEEVKEPERLEVEFLGDGTIMCNQLIPVDKFPAVKEAIEFVLNNEPTDVKFGDYTFKFQSVGVEAKFTQSDIDNARKEGFEAARKTDVNSLSSFDQKPYWLYATFQIYLNHIKESKSTQPETIVRHVYNSMEFETNAGEKLWLCMRDSGYEIKYGETWWEFKEGEVRAVANQPKKDKESESANWRTENLSASTQPVQEPKRDYEIVSFVAKDGWPAVQDSPLWKIHGGESKGIISYETCLETLSIHSVRRLSDGEVFTVGEKVVRNNYEDTIYQFQVDGDKMNVAFHGGDIIGCFDLLNIQKLPPKPQVLFTTENGVEIHQGYEGELWRVFTTETSYEMWRPYNFGMPQYKGIGEKYFSTKEKADEWVLMNKPCLSVNDICALWMINGEPRKLLINLAEQKQLTT